MHLLVLVFALIGALAPEQGPDADAALQVYTGRGWREYGLLVAMPRGGVWTSGELVWSAETLRSAGADAPPADPFRAAPFFFDFPLSGLGPTTRLLPTELQREGFGAGVRLRLTDGEGLPATITGGRLDITVQVSVDGTVPQGATETFSAGADASGERAVNLVSRSAAVAPVRGSRLYWPANATNRGIRVTLTPSRDLSGASTLSISGLAPFRLLIEPLVSR